MLLGSFWVEIYSADTLEIDPDMFWAIVVPFERHPHEILELSGTDLVPFDINPGQYQLLYENRFLEEHEYRALPAFDWFEMEPYDEGENMPELVRLTFIPSQREVEPRIFINGGSELDPDYKPILFTNSHAENAFYTTLSSHE
ncbi:MAG: hypothetical protein F6K19_49655 [Cyanothece sp. SIO1E1]|nr:hypothetical protein [Cyanothece sp. SIO1E1]